MTGGYLDDPNHAETRAKARAAAHPNGIGAAAVRDVSELGFDGKQLLVVISDGTSTAHVEARIARADTTSPQVIDLAITNIEAQAGSFPSDTRLADMAEQYHFPVSTF